MKDLYKTFSICFTDRADFDTALGLNHLADDVGHSDMILKYSNEFFRDRFAGFLQLQGYDKNMTCESSESLDHKADDCICDDNWKNIVKEYSNIIGRKFKDNHSKKIFSFFGIVHGDDDYYYGMCDNENKVVLVSCVGSLENMGFDLLDKI